MGRAYSVPATSARFCIDSSLLSQGHRGATTGHCEGWRGGGSKCDCPPGAARGNLTAGAIFQNPFSLAVDPDRPDVNQLIVAPTLTFSLSNGWFAGLSDFNWTFDWEDGGAASVPLGVQVGTIVTLGKQPVNLAFEIGRSAARPAGTPDPGWILGFELSPLFNRHLGPGKRIRLRGKTAGEE